MKKYIKANKKCYDVLAEEYMKRKNNKSVHEAKVEDLANFLLGNTNDDVLSFLEIGPGAGQTLRFFDSKGCKTVGVELSYKMATVAHNTSPNSLLLVCNVLDIDFPIDTFDAIYVGAVIHLFPKKDAMQLLYSIHRWLKTNGRLFINTTCGKESKEGFYRKIDYNKKVKRFRRFWEEDEFYRFIHENGFDVLDTMYTEEADRSKRWVAYVCKKR